MLFTQLYFSHMDYNTGSPVVSHLTHSYKSHVFKLLQWLIHTELCHLCCGVNRKRTQLTGAKCILDSKAMQTSFPPSQVCVLGMQTV